MANIYWIKGGADAHWDTHTGNWFDDVTGLVQASDGPQDGDYAYLTGATAPDSGPAVPVSLIGLDTSALTAAVTITGDVSISAGGKLVLGAPFGTDVHAWQGGSLSLVNAIIQGASTVAQGVGTDPVFRDTATMNNSPAQISPNASFYDSSGATGANFTNANAFFYGNNTITEADANVVFTGSTLYVFGSLTINNTGANIITGVPNIHLKSRTATFRPIGDITASVALYRPAITHRQRSIS